jgi:hypothetical protein
MQTKCELFFRAGSGLGPSASASASSSQHVLQEDEPVPVRGTLVILPDNLMEQWQDEVSRHVRPGTLRYDLQEWM